MKVNMIDLPRERLPPPRHLHRADEGRRGAPRSPADRPGLRPGLELPPHQERGLHAEEGGQVQLPGHTRGGGQGLRLG